MEYLKINSLWKRQGWYFEEGKKNNPDYQKGRQSFIVGDYAEPEFGNIKKWLVDEKIDGTNIRIIYKFGKVLFGGRTENAQIPCHLLEYLQEHFGEANLSKAFTRKEDDPFPSVILYGEGYGPKIQAVGGNYRKDPGFILFDIFVNGWWLKRDDVIEIAKILGCDVVPSLGLMTEEEIIELVKSKPMSKCSIIPQMIEGVVCRSNPLMLFRGGKPIIWKLKCKEFI